MKFKEYSEVKCIKDYWCELPTKCPHCNKIIKKGTKIPKNEICSIGKIEESDNSDNDYLSPYIYWLHHDHGLTFIGSIPFKKHFKSKK